MDKSKAKQSAKKHNLRIIALYRDVHSDDKRLPAFKEAAGRIDTYAPDSPYITKPIRDKICEKFKYPEPDPSPF